VATVAATDAGWALHPIAFMLHRALRFKPDVLADGGIALSLKDLPVSPVPRLVSSIKS
jgi:hypothetical protein